MSTDVMESVERLTAAFPLLASHYSTEQLAERAEWVETGFPRLEDFRKQDGRDSTEKMRLLVRSCKLLAQQNTFGWLLYSSRHPASVEKVDTNRLFILAWMQDELKDAAEAFRRALYLDPECALAHFSLANLARQRMDRTGTLKHLKNAHRILSRHEEDDEIPHSEGMTAGRLVRIIEASIEQEGRSR